MIGENKMKKWILTARHSNDTIINAAERAVEEQTRSLKTKQSRVEMRLRVSVIKAKAKEPRQSANFEPSNSDE